MKLTRTKVFFLVALFAILVGGPALVSAQSPPHAIFGNVNINGRPGPVGTEITVVFNSQVLDSDTVDNAGRYYVEVPAGGPYPRGSITLRVNGQVADANDPTGRAWAWSGPRVEGRAEPVDLSIPSTRSQPTNTPRPTPTRRPTPTSTPRPTAVAVQVGPRGPQGPPGATGLPGATGAPGATGVPGGTGIPGDRGPVGSQGEQGPEGQAGSAGERGPQGYIGQTGAQGIAGPSGLSGPQGPAGPPGSSGNFLIAIIALVVALLALLVAIGRWIWELQTGM